MYTGMHGLSRYHDRHNPGDLNKTLFQLMLHFLRTQIRQIVSLSIIINLNNSNVSLQKYHGDILMQREHLILFLI